MNDGAHLAIATEAVNDSVVEQPPVMLHLHDMLFPVLVMLNDPFLCQLAVKLFALQKAEQALVLIVVKFWN